MDANGRGRVSALLPMPNVTRPLTWCTFIMALLAFTTVFHVVKKMNTSPPSQHVIIRPVNYSSPWIDIPYEIIPRRAVHHSSIAFHPVARAQRAGRRCRGDCSHRDPTAYD
jgi:hypothetical protein